MSNIAISLLLKAICTLLCQFCDCCRNREECPDGICDSLDLQSRAATESATPPEPGAVQSFEFDWSQLQAVVDAATVLVAAIMAFLGKKNRVGSEA